MKVVVEYFGPAREATGVARETVEVAEPVTAPELIARLARERGGRIARLLLGSDGCLGSSVLLAVGDRQLSVDDPAPLRDGDEVLVIPPVSGG
jgi:molybdopterin converting factor small subunit